MKKYKEKILQLEKRLENAERLKRRACDIMNGYAVKIFKIKRKLEKYKNL